MASPVRHWGEPNPDTSDTYEQCIESAEHWERLADDEERRLTWDPHALPGIVASRAKDYRECAAALRRRAEQASRG